MTTKKTREREAVRGKKGEKRKKRAKGFDTHCSARADGRGRERTAAVWWAVRWREGGRVERRGVREERGKRGAREDEGGGDEEGRAVWCEGVLLLLLQPG